MLNRRFKLSGPARRISANMPMIPQEEATIMVKNFDNEEHYCF